MQVEVNMKRLTHATFAYDRNTKRAIFRQTQYSASLSVRRTLKNGLSEEEKKHIAAYIKGY